MPMSESKREEYRAITVVGLIFLFIGIIIAHGFGPALVVVGCVLAVLGIVPRFAAWMDENA